VLGSEGKIWSYVKFGNETWKEDEWECGDYGRVIKIMRTQNNTKKFE